MPIIWSPRAKRRLREYARNLAGYDHPQTAHDWLVKVMEDSEHLADQPRAGRESPEFIGKHPVVRDITIGKQYRLFYRIKSNCVEIISIHNCKQRITTLRLL